MDYLQYINANYNKAKSAVLNLVINGLPSIPEAWDVRDFNELF